MKKVLMSNECYPIELDNNLNPALLRSDSLLRNAYYIKEESEVYINGEHKYTAKPGDIIISFYGIEDRYNKTEYFLVPRKLFEDYFVRLEKYKASEQGKINNEELCCDCCEPIR
jgi:hypothetical protein